MNIEKAIDNIAWAINEINSCCEFDGDRYLTLRYLHEAIQLLQEQQGNLFNLSALDSLKLIEDYKDTFDIPPKRKTFAAVRRFLKETKSNPLISVDPNGNIDLTYRGDSPLSIKCKTTILSFGSGDNYGITYCLE